MKDPERSGDSPKVADETPLTYVLALNGGPVDPHFNWSRYLPVEATLSRNEHDRNVVPFPEHLADEVNGRPTDVWIFSFNSSNRGIFG